MSRRTRGRRRYAHGGSHNGMRMNNSCPPGMHMMPGGTCMEGAYHGASSSGGGNNGNQVMGNLSQNPNRQLDERIRAIVANQTRSGTGGGGGNTRRYAHGGRNNGCGPGEMCHGGSHNGMRRGGTTRRFGHGGHTNSRSYRKRDNSGTGRSH
jgi:hypothetical protein